MSRTGTSWSGRERNCSFLNTGGERFATISAASGFDFADDARAVAPVDWDHDGDLDLWVSNRNAPRLRFLRNRTVTGNHFVAVKLIGDGVRSNRDSIGARVEVHLEPKGLAPLIKSVRAGEGYLAQTTRWLNFGLGSHEKIKKVVVRWPAGEAETFRNVEVDGHYSLTQGTETATRWHRPGPVAITPSEAELPPQSSPARIPLVTLLSIPTPYYEPFGNAAPVALSSTKDGVVLVSLWASWCMPCLGELKEFTTREKVLRNANIDIVALAVDGLGEDSSDPARAEKFLRKIRFPFKSGRATPEIVRTFQHVHDRSTPLHRPLPVPSSFLLDREGRVAVIYKGPLTVEDLLKDVHHAQRSRLERWRHSAPLPGRAIDDVRFTSARDAWEVRNRFLYARDLSRIPLNGEAAREFREAVRLKPDFAEAQFNLGLVYERLGKLEEAKTHYLLSMEIQPDVAQTHANLGTVLERQGNAAEAIARYREGLRLDPRLPGVHDAIGLLLANSGRTREAKAEFEAEIAVNPDSAVAYNHLGMAYLKLRDFRRAAVAFADALKRKGDYAEAHYHLGLALQQLGRPEKAERYFRNAVTLAPDYAAAHYNLGAVLVDLDRVADAVAHFETAARLNPKLPDVQGRLREAKEKAQR